MSATDGCAHCVFMKLFLILDLNLAVVEAFDDCK